MPDHSSAMRCLLVIVVLPFLLSSQELERDQTARILARLDTLEQQNRDLMAEIRALRQQIAGGTQSPEPQAEPQAPASERIAVAEQQIKDLAQSKVESEHRDPIQLTGMALFNAYANGRASADREYPTTAALTRGPRADGATLRQTILGVKFQAPEKIAGFDVSGSAYVDFFGGTGTSLNQLVRLRIASINFNWKDTTFTVAQDKPIIAPREPESLAQVGVSPLTGAGNLWLWQPQARIEQRFHFGETAGLRAEAGVYETSERNNAPSEYQPATSLGRPSLEGRFVFWADGNGSQFEIAPGFHISDSRVGGYVIPSRIATLDWRLPLTRRLELTGTYFRGENTGVVGGLGSGIAERADGSLHVIRTQGGWAQLKIAATSRLTLDLYGGEEDHVNRDLVSGLIERNQAYAANAIYRVTANLLTSFEWSYLQTAYMGSGNRFNQHYDLAFAYLF